VIGPSNDERRPTANDYYPANNESGTSGKVRPLSDDPIDLPRFVSSFRAKVAQNHGRLPTVDVARRLLEKYP
jgi:hypothetical protein